MEKILGICIEGGCFPLPEELTPGEREQLHRLNVALPRKGIKEDDLVSLALEGPAGVSLDYHNPYDPELPASGSVDITLDDDAKLRIFRELLFYDFYHDTNTGHTFHIYALPSAIVDSRHRQAMVGFAKYHLPNVLKKFSKVGLVGRYKETRNFSIVFREPVPAMTAVELGGYGYASTQPVAVISYTTRRPADTFTHELVHSSLYGFDPTIPRWLHEAIAQWVEFYEEGVRPRERLYWTSGFLTEKDIRKFRGFEAMDWEQPVWAYKIAYHFAVFLEEIHSSVFMEALFGALRDKTFVSPGDTLCRLAAVRNLSDLEEKFSHWLKSLPSQPSSPDHLLGIPKERLGADFPDWYVSLWNAPKDISRERLKEIVSRGLSQVAKQWRKHRSSPPRELSLYLEFSDVPQTQWGDRHPGKARLTWPKRLPFNAKNFSEIVWSLVSPFSPDILAAYYESISSPPVSIQNGKEVELLIRLVEDPLPPGVFENRVFMEANGKEGAALRRLFWDHITDAYGLETRERLWGTLVAKEFKGNFRFGLYNDWIIQTEKMLGSDFVRKFYGWLEEKIAGTDPAWVGRKYIEAVSKTSHFLFKRIFEKVRRGESDCRDFLGSPRRIEAEIKLARGLKEPSPQEWNWLILYLDRHKGWDAFGQEVRHEIETHYRAIWSSWQNSCREDE